MEASTRSSDTSSSAVPVRATRSEPLSEALRGVARRDSTPHGRAAVHQRAVVRLHQLVRAAGRDARGRELALATRPPTRDGLAAALLARLRPGAVLLAVEFDVDDGGRGSQQHGDLLFWEPASPAGTSDALAADCSASPAPGRMVAVECKLGSEARRGARRTAHAAAQAVCVAARVRSWLAHLCAHDHSLARSAAIRDGAAHIVPASLTEAGIVFADHHAVRELWKIDPSVDCADTTPQASGGAG